MRFLSHSPKFQVQVAEPRIRYSNYGDRIVDREGYVAMFTPDDLTEADIEYAEQVFLKEGLINGRTMMIDEVTPTPLLNRLSVFDTEEMALREHWEGQKLTDRFGVEHDKKTFVEQFLTERAETSTDFKLVVELPVEPPWPNYLEFRDTLEAFVQKIVADGYDPSRVLAYERQTRNSPHVVAALERLAAERAEQLRDAETIPA